MDLIKAFRYVNILNINYRLWRREQRNSNKHSSHIVKHNERFDVSAMNLSNKQNIPESCCNEKS